MKKRWVLFGWGFRPFFLLCGVYATVAMGAWMFLYANGLAPFGRLAPSLWHAHELVYGFAGAAIAGFLLTAVPNWTGGKSICGRPLALLVLVWLMGRVAMALTAVLPAGAIVMLEAAFIPGVGLAVLGPLVRSGRAPLVLLIVAFWLSDLVFLSGVFTERVAMARLAVEAGIGIVLTLVTIIGGRIVPVFTANALRKRGADLEAPSSPRLDALVIVAMGAYVLTGIVQAPPVGMAVIAGTAGTLQLARLARWHGHRTWREPIVWILHVAYAALPVGLLLRATFALTGAAWAAHWQHMLTIGAAATMVLAVMTRAALGHTGRPLRVSRAIALAYAALVLATLSRVFGPALLPLPYPATVMLAGGLWLVAFTLFTIVYAPILIGPRADGKPG